MTKLNLIKAALLGATALLATSAHAQAVVDTWDIGGDVSVTASNTTADAVSLDGTNGGFVVGASIADGYKNSISGAAVGSSASASATQFSSNDANLPSFSVTYNGGLTATSTNTVAVSNINDIVDSATITAGQGNSISLAAVGSSASGSSTFSNVNGTAFDDTTSFVYDVEGDVTIQSGDGVTAGLADTDIIDNAVGGNANAVSLQFATGIAAPTIETGEGNSISGAAVGSSASFSLGLNTAAGAAYNEVSQTLNGALNITSTNTADGAVSVNAGTDTDLAVDGAAINAGNSNSISVAGVGASGSFSVSNTMYTGGLGAVAGYNVTTQDISVSTLNEGAVSVNAVMTSAPTISAGNANSISIAGVGASASTSFTTTDYEGAGTSILNGSVQGITLASVNVADVKVTTGLETPTIAGGFNNSISTAAVGASASQSATQNLYVAP